jgi:peptide deformylase
MTKLDIVTLPDPVLRQASAPVDEVSDDIRRLMLDMLETMYEAPGIGLAAVQVGIPRRVVTIDVAREGEEKEPMFLANPEILWRSDERAIYEEGCLSIPEYFAEVERPARIGIRFLDYHGRPQELEAEGLLATVVQHEVDHLNGILFVDYLSKLKRDMVIKRFTKAARMADKERQRRHSI